MRTLPFSLLALAACSSTPTAPQESAEDLFKAIERRYLDAKSLRWTSEAPIEIKADGRTIPVTLLTDAAFQGDDRFKFTMTVKGMPAPAMTAQSDGRALRTRGSPHLNEDIVSPDAAKAGLEFRRFFLRVGFGVGARGSAKSMDLRNSGDVEKFFPLTDVCYGPDAKIGGLDAKSIRYRLGIPGGPPMELTLWVDPKARTPLRRDFKDSEGKLMSETFTSFDDAITFPDAFFDLPKEK
jgi:hypothetical protein